MSDIGLHRPLQHCSARCHVHHCAQGKDYRRTNCGGVMPPLGISLNSTAFPCERTSIAGALCLIGDFLDYLADPDDDLIELTGSQQT